MNERKPLDPLSIIAIGIFLAYVLFSMTGCATYPKTEKEVTDCLRKPLNTWSYCTTVYRKKDEARLRALEWLKRQDPEAWVTVDCRRVKSQQARQAVVMVRIKDLKGDECDR